MKRVSGEEDSVILAEIRKLRNEHTEAANDNKEALERLDNVFKNGGKNSLRVVNAEERLGDTEDRKARLERSVAFLLHQEAKLAAKCDDLESRSRRNNVRIHGIPEDSEKNDTIGFISGFIRSSLQIPAEVDIRIERAHRSLLAKPKENTAPPRAIIVRFLDYRVKEQVIQQAWKQKTTYEGRTIYFNQDYTNEVQKKRKQVRDVIKKLKDKNVKAQSPYPAQLKVFLASGTKIFTTLTEAAPMLRDMGIHVQEEERDELQRLRTQSSWTMVTRQKDKRSQPHPQGQTHMPSLNKLTVMITMYKLEREVKILSWFAYDNRFKPNLGDQNFKEWETKGITAMCTVTKNGSMMSFVDLKEKYGLENSDFFRYLQLRDYFIKEIQTKTSNGVIDILIRTYNRTRLKATSALHKNKRDSRATSTVYINKKWVKELSIEITTEEWLNMCQSLQTTRTQGLGESLGGKTSLDSS
ncbi:hypothetical protein F7725_007667 [Dissostichus mawsoni]|uniref:LINE-1 type transposase domain-containing protein 1 n=1 Tax=Dissostichus mawsoni TaxID=36200 RepID=A0A7J5Y506_DISMA|nr:hypothetical protein F7725_007667 [Dissostichus mawsoni]